MKLDWKTCFRVSVSAFLLYLAITFIDEGSAFLVAVLSAAWPLLLGYAMAYFINIPMVFIENSLFKNAKNSTLLRIKRPVSLLLAFVFMLGVIGFISRMVIPQLISCFQLIIAELPGIIADAIEYIDQAGFFNQSVLDTLESIDWQSTITKILNIFTSGIGGAMDVVVKAVTSTVSIIVNTVVGLIFSIYILLTKERLKIQIKRLCEHFIKRKWYVKSRYFYDVVDDSFHRFIVGQCTEAFILGVLCMLGMGLLKLPYAAMIGALVGFTALIPIAGAFIGASVGMLMIFTVAPIKSLVFLAFFLILQQIEGNLIYPKVVGSSMGLPGMWVLAGVTIGGGVLGIPGMLLGVPLCAATYRLLKNEVNGLRPFSSKKEADLTEEPKDEIKQKEQEQNI